MKKCIILFVLIISGTTFAKDYIELSKKLAKLRAEIENTNQDIQELRERRTQRLRTISVQKAELEASFNSEEIKETQLENQVKELTAKIKELDTGNINFKSIFEKESKVVMAYIESTIPFKKNERVQTLKSLTQEFEKNEVNTYIAVTRLWGIVEDEFRFSRENQLTKDKIKINNKEYLGQVLKLGSVIQFYRLENGEIGFAKRVENKWVMNSIEDKNVVKSVNQLFEGFRKQIRVGEYQVPSFVLKGGSYE